MEIPEIKSRLNIIEVANHLGITINKNQRALCPFHNDKSPSLQFSKEKSIATCFSSNCNLGTVDIIGLTERKLKMSTHEALKYLTKLAGGTTRTSKQKQASPPEPQVKNTAILAKLFKSFQNGLGRAEKPKGYFKSRNLDYTKLETGYNSGQFHHHNKLSEKDMKACIDAGLLIAYKGKTPHAKGQSYTPFAKDCIIFPLKNKRGEIVSLYGRSIIDNNKSKHYYLKNRTGLYPKYPAAGTTKLILTEAIIDAATLLQTLEITNRYEILSLYGTNGLTPEHSEAIKELPELQEIIFFFDGDEAGKAAIKRNAKLLADMYGQPSVAVPKISAIETPENEDINSLLDGHEPEIFTHLINNRLALSAAEGKPFFLSTEKTIERKKEPKPETQPACLPKQREGMEPSDQRPGTSKLNTTNPEFITYTTEELLIIILGGINLQQLDRLRTTLKISRTDTNDPLHSIRHTLDLYHSDYLEKFINKASEQLETGTNILRRAIAELTDKIEKYRLSKIESQKEQKSKQRQLSEQRYRKAIKYLSTSRLMERTNEDIGKTGMVGEENNRLLMYLVFSSRKREQPLHIISLGGSGTGKTYLQEKISELIPEHDKKEITILSENAFYYFERKELKHKLVLIEDMDGAQEVLYPLRELQSKKKISKTLPIKDNKGNNKTVSLHVEGPICLAGTTTKERLYEDNANRSLLIYLDNTKGHKEAIMDYQRKISAGKINTKEEQELKELFKDMQSILKPIKVRNPYAEMLKIPEHVFKPLRTNSHYLAFIETITFYHQYQREVKTDPITGERYIESTLEDIEWANKLLKDVLLAKADELPRQIREFFEMLKNWLVTNKKESFYTKEIREALRMHPSKVKRYISELSRYNLIKVTGGNRYKTGLEYEIINNEDYSKLENGITTILDTVLQEIKNKVSGPVVQQWSKTQNRPLNNKETNNIKAVV